MNLEVSLGEAIDKLTILDIKMANIVDDNRKNQVKKEYDYLKNKLDSYITKYQSYYDMLLDVNKLIWDLQDQIRDKPVTLEYAELCSDIINLNDARFRVKNKLNKLTESKYKEQKGYKLSRCVFICYYGTERNIKMIRQLSMFYDKIIIICKFGQYDEIKSLHNDPDIDVVELLSNDKENELLKEYHDCDIFWSSNDQELLSKKNTNTYLNKKIKIVDTGS